MQTKQIKQAGERTQQINALQSESWAIWQQMRDAKMRGVYSIAKRRARIIRQLQQLELGREMPNFWAI